MRSEDRRSEGGQRRGMRVLLLSAAGLGVVALVVRARTGCQPSGVPGAPDAESAQADDAGEDAKAPLSARCGDFTPLALPPGAYEMGDALVTKDRVFVGVARDVGGKREAALVSVTRDADVLTVATVEGAGELAVDAPPPKVIFLAGKAVLAMYVPSKDARELAIDGAKISQQKDGSFAFDAVAEGAEGLVAWDEDAVGAPRGIVKVAALPIVAGAAARVVSPEASDVDSPRLATRPGGYWIAWLAKKPESERDAEPELEGPGEKRHTTWLEIAQLDTKGALVGAPSRVTKAGTRVDSFDMLASGDGVDLLVKDDEQPADGEGSRLVLVTLRGAETSVRVIAERGAGRGVPDLLGARALFVDLAEHARLLPVAPGSRESMEPDLDSVRPLAAVGDRILAGFPRDSARPLGVFRCFDAPRAPVSPSERKQ